MCLCVFVGVFAGVFVSVFVFVCVCVCVFVFVCVCVFCVCIYIRNIALLIEGDSRGNGRRNQRRFANACTRRNKRALKCGGRGWYRKVK